MMTSMDKVIASNEFFYIPFLKDCKTIDFSSNLSYQTTFMMQFQSQFGEGYKTYKFPQKMWTLGTLHVDNGGSMNKDAPLYASFDSASSPPLCGPIRGHSLGSNGLLRQWNAMVDKDTVPRMQIFGSFLNHHDVVKISIQGPYIKSIEFIKCFQVLQCPILTKKQNNSIQIRK